MDLYHYNRQAFDTIKTRSLQGVVSDKERKDGRDAAAFRGDVGPYYDSVSFLIEPAPLDILGDIFPEDHHTWAAGTELVEHVIDSKDLDIYGWTIVEGPVSMLFNDYIPWQDNAFYKKLFFKSLSFGRRLFGERGDDIRGMEKAIRRFGSGKTREAYQKLPDRKDFKETKNLYAATVPHLMVFVESPIPVKSRRSVTVGDRSSNESTSLPASAHW